MSPSERSVMLVEFGKMEAKLDSLLEYHEDTKKVFGAIHDRLTSLEVTRYKQRAYWRSLVVAGGVVVTILGKLLMFTQRVVVNIPVIPVK